MKKILFFVTLVWGTLVGANNSLAQERYVDEVFTSVKVTSGIQYGSNNDRFGNPTNLMMDVYQPEGDTESNRVLIVIAHEGSFLGGSKTDVECVNYANLMAKRGYIVASIDYRLGWTPGFSAEENAKEIVPALWRAMQDGKAAVRYFSKDFQENDNSFKIDPNRIVSGGFGAGSYIFIQNEFFDLPVEFSIPKVSDSDGKSLIDTVALGGFEGNSGNPGYNWRTVALVNYAGAVGDTAFYERQKNGLFPPTITCQGDLDQTTPFGTAVVFAGGQFPVLEVSGGYEMAREQWDYNVRPFENIDGDGFPKKMINDPNGPRYAPMELYKKGTYTFVGQGYQPWAYDVGASAAAIQKADKYMDSLVRYTSPRLANFLFKARAPQADFGFTNDSTTVNFFDQTAFDPTSWAWDFGDDKGISTEQNPTYIFDSLGSYQVTLIATNASGSDTVSKTVDVVYVGINNRVSEIGIGLYPNPAENYVMVEVSKLK
ncbi:MAG: hypothetical protein ACI81S_001861, partial [Sphingobacteriales bacterium]